MPTHTELSSHPSVPAAEAQRYQPFALIGRGGMAEVFLAVVRGTPVTKLVVLKRIWPDLASDPGFAAMFLEEARLSARMTHPNIVQTYDVTEHAGRLTMAMEYLDGQPLTRVLNRLSTSGAISELTLAQRLRIVIDILAGLDHVHELTDYDGTPMGVVHRDVSPHNVFITYDGHVKLMDFGVAKTVAASNLTRPGTIKGKLAYMAPDQLRAAPVDRRADIFSVGVILWEMLSGRRLWPGMTEVSIVRHLSYGLPLPPLREDLNLPAGLAEVSRRALALNPADRFATAAEMEVELQRLLPVVADSYARHLGKIVSVAFAAERAERQALIDHHLLAVAYRDDVDGPVDDEGADPWLGHSDDDSSSDTHSSESPAPEGAESALSPPGQIPAPRRSWGWFTAGASLLILPAIVVLSLGLWRPSGQARSPRSSVAAAAPSPVQALPRLVAVRPTPGPTPGPAPDVLVSPSTTEPPVPGTLRPPTEVEPIAHEAGRPALEPSESSENGSEVIEREGRPQQTYQRRRRGSNKPWAFRDEVGRIDESHAGNRHATSPSQEASTFSIEVGEARPRPHRREIDTDSPFFP